MSSNDNARITVSGTAYWQASNEQPVPAELLFVRRIQGDEQPCCRRSVATNEWKPLDCGWVNDPSMVVVANNVGDKRQVIPAPAERDEDERNVVFLGVMEGDQCVDFAFVRAGEQHPVSPLRKLYVRCAGDKQAPITVTAFPR